MKIILALALAIAGATAAAAQYGSNNNSLYGGSSYGTGSNSSNHYVAPSINSHGTYSPGHQQTNPNNTQRDNYGTIGNINPYTGNVGTRSPYR
jgi:hypothetical protein